ncbi:MAG: DUF2974 domain-containing protein [Clostridia bacterium]|nr:DUF2974 domain-containing protein [Clostridia bacterium]
MYTIIDYLNNYKNIKVKDVHWNTLDNLLCAVLVYVPIEGFSKKISLEEFYNISQQKKPLPEMMGEMVRTAYIMLDIIKDSDRYKNIKVSNFINMKNENTQFGAATFRVSGKTIVCYKGTDSSLIGWIENFRVTYSYPTFTHNLAIEYLKTNTHMLTDKEVYVAGHSKGGNLAMVSAMEVPLSINKKIKKIYNIDGPGLRKEQFESVAFRNISDRLVNVLPTGSVVGVLLYNENYNVVKSNAIAFSEHYPVTWNVFGEFFVPGVISTISSQLHENTTTGTENLDPGKMQDAFETIFLNLEKNYSSKINFSFEDLRTFYRNMKNLDPEISQSIEKIIGSVLKIGAGKN